MTADQLITNFELQVSDTTELSTSEEFAILNRVYNKICNYRSWEFLKSSVSGTILSDSEGSYITPPTDFAYFSFNNDYTLNNYEADNNTQPIVIFVGTNYDVYQVINYSDRRQYRNKGNYCYYDLGNNKIRFTATPSSTTYEFDYIKTPTTLATTLTPIFPSRFHDILVYAMAVEDTIIQMSPKATSYAVENQTKYQSMLDDMSYWDSQFKLS